jgi:hypothetical protein
MLAAVVLVEPMEILFLVAFGVAVDKEQALAKEDCLVELIKAAAAAEKTQMTGVLEVAAAEEW